MREDTRAEAARGLALRRYLDAEVPLDDHTVHTAAGGLSERRKEKAERELALQLCPVDAMWDGLTPAQGKDELDALAQQLMVEEGTPLETAPAAYHPIQPVLSRRAASHP